MAEFKCDTKDKAVNFKRSIVKFKDGVMETKNKDLIEILSSLDDVVQTESTRTKGKPPEQGGD